MGWRTHQLNRAFSAYEFFDDSNLGRCPRLQMNRAFGAKHVRSLPGTTQATSPRDKSGCKPELRSRTFKILAITAGKVGTYGSASLRFGNASDSTGSLEVERRNRPAPSKSSG